MRNKPNIRKLRNSTHREFRRREMSINNELYYNNIYESPYGIQGRGSKPNRRMNGRSMGVCGSCANRRGKRGRR
jgi:hypothetical protein